MSCRLDGSSRIDAVGGLDNAEEPHKLKIFLGILASLILLTSVSVCLIQVNADNTVPPKDVEKDKTVKSNTKYKLSMKNKYMKIKANTGIQINLPNAKKAETAQYETPEGVKILTKSKGTKNKEINVRVSR